MGAFEAKRSLILRMYSKYFLSLEAIASKAAPVWRSYYTIGNLSVTELDKKNRKTVLRLEEFPLYDEYCRDFEGFLGQLVKMVVNKEVSYKETKCISRGDPYHEFTLRW